MSEKFKVAAIISGGDWVDASCEHIVIPADMDLKSHKEAHQKWYREVYLPSLKTENRVEYVGFIQWLLLNGAREVREDELIEFYDD